MLWLMETMLLERSLPSMKVVFAGGELKGNSAENAQGEMQMCSIFLPNIFRGVFSRA